MLKHLAEHGSLPEKKTSKDSLKELTQSIEKSFDSYNNLPQDEKDRLCVELAQRMGCESSDVLVCSNYIYDYTWSDKEVS